MIAQAAGVAAPSAPLPEGADDRSMIDNRAIDSVDAQILKGVTKVEVEVVELDDHGQKVLASRLRGRFRVSGV